MRYLVLSAILVVMLGGCAKDSSEEDVEIAPQLGVPFATCCKVVDFEVKTLVYEPGIVGGATRGSVFNVYAMRINKLENNALKTAVTLELGFWSKSAREEFLEAMKTEQLGESYIVGYETLVMSGFPNDPNDYLGTSDWRVDISRNWESTSKFIIVAVRPKEEANQ